jgi:hypothetical protein
MKCWLLTALIIVIAGCDRQAPTPDGFRAGWVDVQDDEQRYYGLYLCAGLKNLQYASGVLLVPWEDRSDCTITSDGTNTIITINGKVMEYQGRPLLILSTNGAVEVIAEDLMLKEFQTMQDLEEYLQQVLNE